jgi:hypothetical protein
MPRAPTRSPLVRTILFVLGCLLIMACIAAGRDHPRSRRHPRLRGRAGARAEEFDWARGRFARLKRRWPRFGHYSDMALRRRSFRRRQQRAREAARPRRRRELLGFPADPR